MIRGLGRVVLPCTLGLAIAAADAAAGEDRATDGFAGYSFMKLDGTGRHGVHVALGFDLTGPLSGFVDASLHRGSDAGVSLIDTTLMVGPGVRRGGPGGTAFFLRVLAGLVRSKASISVLDVDISETHSRFGLLAGGGVDFQVGEAVSLRVAADYLWNRADEGKASGFRGSAGVVYRFGSAR